MGERLLKQAEVEENLLVVESASHVTLNAKTPKLGARFPLRLAKGVALPPPFDPPLPGMLSPLDPDAGKGGAPLPAPTQLSGDPVPVPNQLPQTAISAPADSDQALAVTGELSMSPARRPVPWRGRKRVTEPRTKFVAVRCTPAKHAAYSQAAERAGLSVADYVRLLVEGSPPPRAAKRPPVEKQELARLLGQLGKLGSNVNQLTHAAHVAGAMITSRELHEIGDDVRAMRSAVMKALGRGD